MITLNAAPRLAPPSGDVRVSFLTGEQADCTAGGIDTSWLGPASEDFDGYVAACRGVQRRWDVPFSTYWYVSGEHYLGTLVIRHELTAALLADGGHIGYHVSPAWRRQGHATRMLAAGLTEARQLGLTRVLLTCSPDNEASRKVIVNNGGRLDETLGAELRYWIDLGSTGC
ncbi:GNAT family N-acetyltransferase [Dactylosporangium sp. NPDC000521]|uniref:GNAT family N-acetyltransferase n=1 Tax=Dactylosporangium sp. NPDC000521 TaxID=3363975 RepID=UPI003696A73B